MSAQSIKFQLLFYQLFNFVQKNNWISIKLNNFLWVKKNYKLYPRSKDVVEKSGFYNCTNPYTQPSVNTIHV